MAKLLSTILILSASLLAAGIAIWIGWKTRGAKRLPGCSEDSGCAAIAATRWSKWMTIPVAPTAAIFYLLLAASSALHAFTTSLSFPGFTTFLAIFIGSASLWFIFLQIFIVKKFCMYCNIVHVLGLLICIVVLSGFRPTVTAQMPLPSLIAFANVGLLLLIAGQVLLPHKTYALVRSSATKGCSIGGKDLDTPAPGTAEQGAATSLPSQERATPSDSSKEIFLRSGMLKLKVSDWPRLGPVDAADIIALAFDYTCPVCRTVHKMVEQIVHQADKRLAVLLLPMPQHPACNRNVHKVSHGHAYACQYSRLAISLWLSHPDQFEEFDAFLSAGNETPPLGLAIRRFQDLTGESINPHAPDAWLDRIIARAIEIYEGLKVKQIPNLLLPNGEVHGSFDSVAALRAVLLKELQIVPNQSD